MMLQENSSSRDIIAFIAPESRHGGGGTLGIKMEKLRSYVNKSWPSSTGRSEFRTRQTTISSLLGVQDPHVDILCSMPQISILTNRRMPIRPTLEDACTSLKAEDEGTCAGAQCISFPRRQCIDDRVIAYSQGLKTRTQDFVSGWDSHTRLRKGTCITRPLLLQ